MAILLNLYIKTIVSSYQLEIIATRTEQVTQIARAKAFITVIRNQNPPVFTRDVYEVNFSELVSYANLTTVLATDADGVSFLFLYHKIITPY